MKKLFFALSPTRYELVAYLVVALMLLSIGSLASVVDVLTEGNVDKQAVWQFGEGQIDKFFVDTGTNNIGGALSLALFWGSLGALIYAAFWVIANLYVSLHNKYVYKAEYVHMPLASHEHQLAHYSRLVLRASIALICLLYVMIWLRLLYPVALVFIERAITLWPDPKVISNGLASVALVMLGIHTFTLLLRALYLRLRLYE